MRSAGRKLVNFILRFRVLHLLFWLFKYYSLVHQLKVNIRSKINHPYLDASLIIILQCVAVYFIVLYLLPKFFPQRKFGRFGILSLLVLIATSFISVWLKDHITRWFFDPSFHSHYSMVFLGEFVDSVIVAFVFIVLYIAYYYYRDDRQNKLLERQQLEAELIFLRAQINPHFIFNSLNSIYVLMDEDPETAKSTLLRFSNLLRYQLYESGYAFTSLASELKFIKDYTELEKVRHGDRIRIVLELPTVPEYIRIGSLLLIPFVENAFKHISVRAPAPVLVKVTGSMDGGIFNFTVVNSADPPAEPSSKEGGIGLQNVKRRLELLYKEKYTISNYYSDGFYYLNLTITTDEDKLPGH